MRILVEASTESEWVAQHLERSAMRSSSRIRITQPMYGQRSRRVKTDRRDVAALTEACQRGIVPAGASSIGAATRGPVATQCAAGAGANTDASDFVGARVSRAAPGCGSAAVHEQDIPDSAACARHSATMTTTLSPLRSVIEVLDDELASADDSLKALVETIRWSSD